MKSFFQIDDRLTTPLFVATVEDNNDPTFNYRVKVRIPDIHHDTITTEHLPWAARLDSNFMGIGEEQDLKHSVPEVGTKVLVLAIGNNLNSLIYLGVLYKKTAQTPSDNKYLDTYGIYRKDGQFIGIDKVKKLFQMLFDGDIEIDKVHNIKINATDDITINCNNTNVTMMGQATITTTGATNLNANGNLVVTAPTSTFNGNIVCTGTVAAKGAISSESEVSAMGGATSMSTHTHTFPYNAGPSPATGQTDPGVG